MQMWKVKSKVVPVVIGPLGIRSCNPETRRVAAADSRHSISGLCPEHRPPNVRFVLPLLLSTRNYNNIF